MRPLLACSLALALAGAVRAEGPGSAPDAFDPSWRKAFEPPDDSWRRAKQDLVYVNASEPETLDPQVMTGVPEHTLALALYEGLVSYDPETLQPRPGVAERWEVSPDGKVYTFHLRADAKFSNGDPVTAEDFRWTYWRALVPETRADYAYMFDCIEGSEEFRRDHGSEGYEAYKTRVKVEVPDPRTLRVTLRAPTAYFLDLCGFETYMPVHRATVEKHGEQWTRVENWVGNGPFVLAEWLPRQRIVMKPNPHWWGRSFVKLTSITALPIEDVDTAHNKYMKKECDWTRDVPLGKIEEASRDPEYFVQPYLSTYFYRFNTTRKPLDDRRVRMALSLAINRETITRDILKAGQIPAEWFCPAVNGYQPPRGLAHNPDRARALLAEAGFPGGRGFPQITLLYNTHEAHKTVAEAITQMWRETLGINVALRNTEWKVYLKQVEMLDYDIARAGWTADYSDPNTFLDMWLTGGGNNNTGWGSAKYDDLIRRAQVELDAARRLALYQEAEKIVVEEEFPILPVYIYVNKGMKRDTLQGWYENLRDLHPFQYMYFVP